MRVMSALVPTVHCPPPYDVLTPGAAHPWSSRISGLSITSPSCPHGSRLGGISQLITDKGVCCYLNNKQGNISGLGNKREKGIGYAQQAIN